MMKERSGPKAGCAGSSRLKARGSCGVEHPMGAGGQSSQRKQGNAPEVGVSADAHDGFEAHHFKRPDTAIGRAHLRAPSAVEVHGKEQHDRTNCKREQHSLEPVMFFRTCAETIGFAYMLCSMEAHVSTPCIGRYTRQIGRRPLGTVVDNADHAAGTGAVS